MDTSAPGSNRPLRHVSAAAAEAPPMMAGRSGTLDGAVVIGSEYRQLGLIRSLGRRGVPVWVLAGDHWLGRVTRYAHRVFKWPHGSDAERLAYLVELSARHRLETWALFPAEDVDAA